MPPSPAQPPKSAREERLARALRENLKRRKAQSRELGPQAEPEPEPEPAAAEREDRR